jgi:membrane protease YdiL (CAAX protease family)
MLIFWPEGYKALASNRETVAGLLGDITLRQIFILCIAVGIYEEIVFRGYVLARMRQLLRCDWLAVLMAALIFGSLHIYQGAVAVAMITVLGLILGGVVLWRKSLMPAIVAHFLFNTGMLLLMYFDIGPDPEMIESLG